VKAFEREYGDGKELQHSTGGLASSEVTPRARREPLPKQGPVEPVVSVEQREPGYEARKKAREEHIARERARAHDYLRRTSEHGDGVTKGL
jgi:hypothetical protein